MDGWMDSEEGCGGGTKSTLEVMIASAANTITASVLQEYVINRVISRNLKLGGTESF